MGYIVFAYTSVIGVGILLSIIFYRGTIKEQRRYEERMRNSGIAEIDRMNGRDFENYLLSLFKSMGYKVSATSVTGDYGVDLILHIDDKKIIVQAKRYSNKVGIKAVQEISAAKSYFNADECWVVTNNYFTDPAYNLAKSNNVILKDRDVLINWIIEMKQEKVLKRAY